MAIGTPSATTLGGKKHHSLKITESLEKNNKNKKKHNFANCFLQRLQLLVVIYPSFFFCNYAISKSWPQNNNQKVMQTLAISNLITCSILWVFVVVVLEIPEVMAVSQSSYKVKAWCFLAGKKLIWFRPNGTQKPPKKPFWRWCKLTYEMLKIRLLFKKEQSSISVMVSIYVNPTLQQTTTNNQQRKSATEFELLNKKMPEIEICLLRSASVSSDKCTNTWEKHSWLVENPLGEFWKEPKKNGFRLVFSQLDLFEMSMRFQWFMLIYDIYGMVIYDIYGYADVCWF